jgi:hypothetical protein
LFNELELYVSLLTDGVIPDEAFVVKFWADTSLLLIFNTMAIIAIEFIMITKFLDFI